VSAPPTQPRDSEKGRGLDARTIIPAVAVLALIVVPILIWATTSGGTDDGMRIEEGVSVTGGPEIVVSVPKDKNTSGETSNSSNVKLICVDASGGTVLAADHDWPFINEPGFPLPHQHQAVSPEQLQEIAKCRLDGTKTKLEGDLRRSSKS
jgi:hypothetical protein